MSRKSSIKKFTTRRRSPVMNAPAPRPSIKQPVKQPGQPQITREMIAKRAYEIWLSGKSGSQEENWYRAERELRSGRA